MSSNMPPPAESPDLVPIDFSLLGDLPTFDLDLPQNDYWMGLDSPLNGIWEIGVDDSAVVPSAPSRDELGSIAAGSSDKPSAPEDTSNSHPTSSQAGAIGCPSAEVSACRSGQQKTRPKRRRATDDERQSIKQMRRMGACVRCRVYRMKVCIPPLINRQYLRLTN